MQLRTLILSLALVFANTGFLHAQYQKQDTTYKKHFIGSTLFLFGNLIPSNRPDFVQLNFGHRLSGRDVVSLEVKTWKYAWSLGIPYGPSFEAPEHEFPGFIREYGVAVAYQRYWWKGLYTGIHNMHALQSFVNEEGNRIDRGYQVFNTYRLGYHVKLANDRLFIEPSIAITHRFYQTAMPESFKTLDDPWSKFFVGEPGLHIGYNL